jgi:2-deoxy-D-gluconate 3-dehydrogenase
VIDLDETTAADAAAEVRRLGRRAAALRADVSDVEQVEAMVQSAIGSLGRIDVLVNNAGICIQKPVLEMSPDEWLEVMAST